MKAKIVLEYSDEKIAHAVTQAISPDNFQTPPKLKVKTCVIDGKVESHVQLDGKLSTLIRTIDDLLFCVSTAEKAVWMLKKS